MAVKIMLWSNKHQCAHCRLQDSLLSMVNAYGRKRCTFWVELAHLECRWAVKMAFDAKSEDVSASRRGCGSAPNMPQLCHHSERWATERRVSRRDSGRAADAPCPAAGPSEEKTQSRLGSAVGHFSAAADC